MFNIAGFVVISPSTNVYATKLVGENNRDYHDHGDRERCSHSTKSVKKNIQQSGTTLYSIATARCINKQPLVYIQQRFSKWKIGILDRHRVRSAIVGCGGMKNSENVCKTGKRLINKGVRRIVDV